MSAVFAFERHEAQIAGLRELCAVWCATDHFWTFDDVLAAFNRPGSVGYFAAEAAMASVWNGFVFAAVGTYSADLLYIFVRPQARGAGIGQALFSSLVTALRLRISIEALFLEVRVSNKAAQRLYTHFGMLAVGQRVRYYADGETALVYKLALK